MTDAQKNDTKPTPELPWVFDRKEMLAVRVRPAEFARILGTSKQTVSTWIKQGKVTINVVDGRLDLHRAIQDVLRTTPHGKLRNRVLRQAVGDAGALRQNLASAEDRADRAEADLSNARLEIERLTREIADEGRGIDMLLELIVMHADQLRETPTDEWMDHLVDLDLIAIKIVAGTVDLATYKREALMEGGGGDDSDDDDAVDEVSSGASHNPLSDDDQVEPDGLDAARRAAFHQLADQYPD